MAETLEHESMTLESTTVKINRTAATVKGGRRMSFSALVVVGDRNGNVGIGYGKAPGVPAAIEKAQKDARKNINHVELRDGTLPHPITGRFGASSVRLIPAAPGTGVIAGGTVRAVLEMAGVQDCLTKSYGWNNEINVVKAVMTGLQGIKTRDQIAALRGIELETTEVEDKIAASKAFQKASEEAAAKAAAEAAKRAPMRPKPAPKKEEPRNEEAKADKSGVEEGKPEEANAATAETTVESTSESAEQASAAATASEAPAIEAPADNVEQASGGSGDSESQSSASDDGEEKKSDD